MRISLVSLLPVAALLLHPAPAGAAVEPTVNDYMVMYKTTKLSFDDVAQFLELAITDRGFKIDDHAFIGRMLTRTGESLGKTKKVYENAQQYRFCPAIYSRNMLSANPHNIAFCPFIINFYNLPEDPKTVYVMFRRPKIVGSEESRTALRAVEKLLRELIEEALE